VVTFPAYPQTSVSARSVEVQLEDVAELVAMAEQDKLSAEALTNLKRQFDRLENKISAENARIKADFELKSKALDLLLI
jgi:hypothetical protein